MANVLKNISSKQIANFLTSYAGTKLTSFPKLPLYFSIKK